MRYTKESLQAMNNHLNSMASGAYVSKTAFPGTNFIPPTDAMWLKVDYLFAKPVMIGAFVDGHYREQGIYQIMVYGPKGQGAFSVIGLVDQIMDHFERGTELTGVGPTVKIERTYRSNPMEEAPWIKVPVSVEFWWYAPYRSN